MLKILPGDFLCFQIFSSRKVQKSKWIKPCVGHWSKDFKKLFGCVNSWTVFSFVNVKRMAVDGHEPSFWRVDTKNL